MFRTLRSKVFRIAECWTTCVLNKARWEKNLDKSLKKVSERKTTSIPFYFCSRNGKCIWLKRSLLITEWSFVLILSDVIVACIVNEFKPWWGFHAKTQNIKLCAWRIRSRRSRTLHGSPRRKNNKQIPKFVKETKTCGCRNLITVPFVLDPMCATPFSTFLLLPIHKS